MSYIEETNAAKRHVFPDLVRAFALFGIVLVNVGIIAYPMMQGYLDGGLNTPLDKSALFVVNSLFLMKSYTLFSFMFGVGLAYQMKAAEKASAVFATRYFRRILGLLILGLLHVAFLFQGDILVIYAILGSVLFLFRNISAKALKRWAIGIYIVQILIVTFFAFVFTMGQKYAPEEMAKEMAKMDEAKLSAISAYGNGGFVDTIAVRFSEWSQVVSFGLLMQGFGALAFFLFGLAAVRTGKLTNPEHLSWMRYRRIFLPIGIVGSAFGAWVSLHASGMMDPKMMLSMVIIAVFAPFSTAGYLGLIAKWVSQGMTPLKIFLARAGTSSLTAYLMQGLLLSLIFNNYGFGMYQKIGAAGCIAIAFVVGCITLSFSSLWRMKFKRGPFEYLLRGWTYLGKS